MSAGISIEAASARLPAATWPREDPTAARLLCVDPTTGSLTDARVSDLPRLLYAGDLVVVNDAATLPASLVGTTAKGPIEVRLAGPPSDESGARLPAVLFGAGDWRQRTEDRPPPPPLAVGERLAFGGLLAEVGSVSRVSPRLVELRFDRAGDELWDALFRLGRPVQYSYLRAELPLWHVQTAFASRPWAVEMPSAGFWLRLPIVRALRRRGVGVAAVTHAAGLSSSGDPRLDAALPLPERYEIGQATVKAVRDAKAAGGRVVAVGTSVVRALEAAALRGGGRLAAGRDVTDLRLGPTSSPSVVDGVLTGLHEPGESHFELLRAFAPAELLEVAVRHAAAAGYQGHEFGDLSLVLAR